MKKLLIFISMMILLSSFVSANISIRADANDNNGQGYFGDVTTGIVSSAGVIW